MAKYLKKYAQELLDGMRKDGKSIVECCLIWGITDKEYNDFVVVHKDLQYAHEIGEMDCAAWWHINYRKLAENGNASALSFGMKNIDRVGWQDRPDSKAEAVEPVKAIEITILPPRNEND
jgi:hypothetical protein